MELDIKGEADEQVGSTPLRRGFSFLEKILKTFLLVVVLALSASVATAGDSWDRTDKILLGACLATAALDYGQTMHIARNPGEHFEYNPLLGEHPSPSTVRNAFLIGGAVKIIVAELLPSRYRKVWLGGLAVTSGIIVGLNRKNGISFEW